MSRPSGTSRLGYQAKVVVIVDSIFIPASSTRVFVRRPIQCPFAPARNATPRSPRSAPAPASLLSPGVPDGDGEPIGDV